MTAGAALINSAADRAIELFRLALVTAPSGSRASYAAKIVQHLACAARAIARGDINLGLALEDEAILAASQLGFISCDSSQSKARRTAP